MREIGRGTRVFDHAPVQGRWRRLSGPDDVIELMDTGAGGVVAVVDDAGATFLGPVHGDLTAVVSTGGTERSHIAIVSREFQVPCVMACSFPDGEPADGADVEVDCSDGVGIVRA